MYYYSQNCHTCRHAKACRDKYNNLLKPLLILSHHWTGITLDFVTEIPPSNGYNVVLMVIDWLTKNRY